ncbi:MAG TPA: ABC transporter permease [Streptosporangiaceae bacterium]|nr:ABC transporter permease [Streptosporangiaceae bacterium]
MFFIYLRRELRRRMRQVIFISLGLAVGIGLVITVTAASAGVAQAQGAVLHSLYGVGTDITVTKAPAGGSGGPFGFRVRGRTGTGTGARPTRPAPGTKFSRSVLLNRALGPVGSSSVTSISGLHGVAAAGGALALTDLSISGTVPNVPAGGGGGGFGGGGGGGGGFASSFSTSTFTVNGTQLTAGEVGPLSSGKITSGRTFTTADAASNVAVIDSSYARQNKLTTSSKISVGGTSFKVIGIVKQPQGGSPANVYIPLGRAQALAGMKNQVNTIYVAASSSTMISTVSKEIAHVTPKATVTTSSDLADEVTGSLASASGLARNLGKWLAIAVLAAAFLLASLLTMSAVSRRVREFGTLKALGWRSRRIVGQVLGESVTIGIIGGLGGIVLGFAGAALVSRLAPPLTATTGLATGSATPGGARAFAGGGPPGGGGAGGGGGFGGFRRLAADAASAVTVHLSAQVTLAAVALAVVLAIAGGLIAGGFGGWRAARLRPADALARVE